MQRKRQSLVPLDWSGFVLLLSTGLLVGLVASCDALSNTAGGEPTPRVNDGYAGPVGWGSGSNEDGSAEGDEAGGGGSLVGDEGEDDDLAAVLLRDSDGDGITNFDELDNGTDPYDSEEGGDLDGDGIPNFEDDDVDGDGLDNEEDPDVDGDGTENGEDADVDGDGEEADEDGDDDGDGEEDEEDEDDDGDGEDDCECVHGLCGILNNCTCFAGWTGDACDEVSCDDVFDCSDHGECVGPNECRCNEGWIDFGGLPCSKFHCDGLSNCSGHGRCVGPNDCDCDPKWDVRFDCSVPTCFESPTECDDGEPCTRDSCNLSGVCKHDPITCTSPETCVGGTCTTPCTSSTECNGKGCRDGGCFDCESDLECADDDPCTVDTCSQGRCSNPPLTCRSGRKCVLGKCVRPCERDTQCTSEEKCRDGGCMEACNDDGDCDEDEGEICDDGACIPDEDEGIAP